MELGSDAPLDLDGVVGGVDDLDELVHHPPLVLEGQRLPGVQVVGDLVEVELPVAAPLLDLPLELLFLGVQLTDAPADVAVHHVVGGGQPVHQGGDLGLHLGEPHPQSGQLRVRRRPLLAAEGGPLGHFFPHLLVDDLLHVVGVDGAGARAGFRVHAVGAEEVSGLGGGVAFVHQGVAAHAALDLSCQPGVLGLVIWPHLPGPQALAAALEPHLRRDDALVGGQDQVVAPQIHLLAAHAVLALVVVAAVDADKVGGVVGDDGPLGLVEFVDRQIRPDVNGIAEHVRQPGALPGFAPFRDAVFLEVSDNVAVGALRLGVELVHEPHHLRLLRDDLVHGGLDAADDGGDQPVAIGHPPAHVKALLAPGKVGVGHPLLDGLPLQLGEDDADVEHGPAHGGGGVELLRGGDELHPVLAQSLHHAGEVQDGAADAVQLVDDDLAELSRPHILHHLLEGGAVGVLAAVSPVDVGLVGFPPRLVLAELDLAIDGDAVSPVHRLPRVNCVHGIQLSFFWIEKELLTGTSYPSGSGKAILIFDKNIIEARLDLAGLFGPFPAGQVRAPVLHGDGDAAARDGMRLGDVVSRT